MPLTGGRIVHSLNQAQGVILETLKEREKDRAEERKEELSAGGLALPSSSVLVFGGFQLSVFEARHEVTGFDLFDRRHGSRAFFACDGAASSERATARRVQGAGNIAF